jgi:hypothetical protein
MHLRLRRPWIAVLAALLLSARAAFGATALSGTSSFVVANCSSDTLTLRFISDAVPLAV